MNMRDMPGPGDYERFPITSPNDPRFDDDIGEEEAIDVIVEHIVAAQMKSAKAINEAFSELTPEDYEAFAAALSEGQQHRAGVLLRYAVKRIVKADAMKEARIRYERMRREDEADAAAARMGR